jgi:colanic acid biosynthesis glycosyl transferase WcaI
MVKRLRVGVLYQFFHPDDVVSARIFSDFCAELSRRGWEVTAWPCNRPCHDAKERYPLTEEWEGVAIRRIWRPALRQASKLGRVVNAAWMFAAWCWALLRDRRNRPDVLVIGTDPILSILIAPVVRKFLPDIRIVHWCFDVYPEYAIAEDMFRADIWPVRRLKRLLRAAYTSCDLVADLGSCMRSRLEEYGHTCTKTTLTPWALAEPPEVELPDPATRHELFGDNALGLLYSGNFGRPHSYADLLSLARRLRDTGIHLTFGVRGSRSDELRQEVQPADTNVSFAGFAPEAALEKRLAAADIHMVSLRPEFTGLAVPSKFFGSLASGRPVIFSGSDDSALARWIEEYKIGWVLNENTQERVATELLELRSCRDKLQALQQHCFEVYHEHFSYESVVDEWDRQLRALVSSDRDRTKAKHLTLVPA